MRKTKDYVSMAMLVALSYCLLLIAKFPVVMFLKYEPKDVIIAIAGFMYGPVAGVIVTAVVCLLELTISSTGIIGMLMNFISTVAFILPAAIIYKRQKNIKSVVSGFVLGTILMTAVMILANYAITPLYLNVPRAEVAKLLFPVFLPFNLFKGFLNSALITILYKPIVNALATIGMTDYQHRREKHNTKLSFITAGGFLLIAVLILIFCFII